MKISRSKRTSLFFGTSPAQQCLQIRHRSFHRAFAWSAPLVPKPPDSKKLNVPAPVFPEPNFTLNRGSLATKFLDGYKFAIDGSYSRVKYGLSGLTGVHARDFLHLDVFKSLSQEPEYWSLHKHTRQVPTILPRGNCIIVSISHIKAIICHDHVFLMDIHRPVVRHFAEFLKTFLHVVETHANPLLALETGLKGQTEFPKPLLCEGKEGEAGSCEADKDAEPKKDAEGARRIEAATSRKQDGERQKAGIEQPLDFEFRVLEAILSFAVAKYARRIQLYEPVVTDLLKRMIVDATQIEYQALQRLLPISNSLSSFERSTNEVINVLKDLLNNNDDMLEMSLTEKFKRSGELPPMKQHEECELLLESYLREISHVNRRAFALRKQIQTSQDILNISMSSYRNQITKVNVQMAFATVGLSVGTVGAGLFGMNLLTGLEQHPQAFLIVTSGCLGLAGLVYLRLSRLALPQNVPKVTLDQRKLDRFLNKLAECDIQDIVLHRIGIEEVLTKEEFSKVLQEATGRKIDSEEVDLVFRVFDANHDNALTRTDLVKLLCDVHNRFTSRTIDGF